MAIPNNQEIERKYFLKGLPENLNILKIIKINQSYLYKDKYTIVRIRKMETFKPTSENKEIEYIYCVKTKGNLQEIKKSIANKYEIEHNISEKSYQKLISKKISNTINKTRFVIPI